MGKIIYHRDIKDQVIILDKEIDYCITNGMDAGNPHRIPK